MRLRRRSTRPVLCDHDPLLCRRDSSLRRPVPPQALLRRPGRDNRTVMRWRRWVPGSKHGMSRGMVVWGDTQGLGPDQLNEVLGRCEGLDSWARMRGFVLSGIPQDLEL